MDKNTLSNYGWIVIAVLVLSVMIALATPFGEYIKAGVESTTAGLFETQEKAMNVVGMTQQGKHAEIVYDGSVDGYTIGGYMGSDGNPVTSTGNYYSDVIPVKPSEVLYVSLEHEGLGAYNEWEKSFCNNVGAFVFFDKEDNYVGMLKHADFNDIESDYITIKSITVPKNATKMYVNMGNSGAGDLITIKYLKIQKVSYEGMGVSLYNSVLPATNNLTNKKYIAFGDSITDGYLANYVSYADYIACANSMTLTERATGGYKSSDIISTMQSNSSLLSSLGADDFVIIGGFVNDPSKDVPLGTLTAVGTTEFDTTTSIGTLEKMFYDYTNNANYKAKIGVVLTPQPNGSNAYRDKPEYWTGWISVLEKYNIPYLNLYDVDVDYVDGVHPSSEGQKTIAALVETWMNTL